MSRLLLSACVAALIAVAMYYTTTWYTDHVACTAVRCNATHHNDTRTYDVPTTAVSDFLDYFDRMEDYMQTRFDAMNSEFERAMSQPPPEGTTSYSKSVTRSYNGPGKCGEEVIVERDSAKGKEVKTVTRRIGDRAIQQVSNKDLATGKVESSVTRQQLAEADDAAFDAEWAEAEKKYIAPSRGLLRDHHHHHHEAPQIEHKK